MTSMAAGVAAGSVAADQVVPGVLGFLVVAGMAVALYFLLRSMNRHLRNVQGPGRGPGQDHGPADTQAGPGPAAGGSSRP